MSGRKLFTNLSALNVAVTLLVRASANPRDIAGTREFMLAPGEAQWQEYGDRANIYLNGIRLVAIEGGEMRHQDAVVIARGSELDDSLNKRNGVDIAFVHGHFSISTRQVG